MADRFRVRASVRIRIGILERTTERLQVPVPYTQPFQNRYLLTEGMKRVQNQKSKGILLLVRNKSVNHKSTQCNIATE